MYDLEQVTGAGRAAEAARRQAIGSYLDYRRAGGESQCIQAEFFTLVSQAIQQGDRAKGNLGLLITTIVGAFFVGVQVYEYIHLVHDGMTPEKDIMAGCFYVMTGIHGLHVLLGVIAMAVVTIKGYMGHFSPKNYAIVEYTGLYWHFVDLVWIILFAIVYLI